MAERSCVIVVENLPVPMDRRVWQEALALRQAGWTVSVICPMNERHPASYEMLDGIAIYRHPLPLEARGRFAFLFEYAAALFHEFRLLLKVWRERGFAVIQACNPPDLIFLIALPFKLIGKRFVFDHHDVCPELFEAKFNRKGIVHRALLLAEKCTFMAADMVISANDTYRDLAISRGGKNPRDVVAVYSIPDKSRIYRLPPDVSLRQGKKFVLGYVGVIGDQDGVDHLVLALDHLVNDHGLRDFHAIVVGDGPALASARQLATSQGLDEFVTFTGYLNGKELLRQLNAFDIGIIPDPVNAYNDKISMNKVFEYSALGIPSVAYPLTETKRLLGHAGVYAQGDTPSALARACAVLMQDDELRTRCANEAARLAQHSFSWSREAGKYVAAYERLSPSAPAPVTPVRIGRKH
jgi:glycosyltransferase involved in cell wall biosynthesis